MVASHGESQERVEEPSPLETTAIEPHLPRIGEKRRSMNNSRNVTPPAPGHESYSSDDETDATETKGPEVIVPFWCNEAGKN